MLILFEDLSQSLQVLYRYIYIKTLSDRKGLNLHQFILHIAQSDLFRMAQSSQPVRIRVHHVELVMAAQIIVLMSGRKAVTRVQYRSLDDNIRACFIQSHRVCSCLLYTSMGGSQFLYFIERFGSKVRHFTASVFRYVSVIDAVIMIVTKQARKHLIDNHFFIFPHSVFYFMI